MGMQSSPVYSCFNGSQTNFLPLTSRGYHYGDGLFETILVIKGEPVLLDLHLDRLFRGCDLLSLFLCRRTLETELQLGLKSLDGRQGVLKLIASRPGEGRGYGFDSGLQADLGVLAYELDDYDPRLLSDYRVAFADYRLGYNPVLAGTKHLNRLEQVMSSSSLMSGIQDLLVLGQNGDIIETRVANVFLVCNGCLLTPLLDRAGVSGVMRQHLLDVVAPEMGLTTSEQRLNPQDVIHADEIFACNSVFGVRQISRVGVRQFGIRDLVPAIQEKIAILGYETLYR
jgi:4-amino-4-deoxychorismate lyase